MIFHHKVRKNDVTNRKCKNSTSVCIHRVYGVCIQTENLSYSMKLNNALRAWLVSSQFLSNPRKIVGWFLAMFYPIRENCCKERMFVFDNETGVVKKQLRHSSVYCLLKSNSQTCSKIESREIRRKFSGG